MLCLRTEYLDVLNKRFLIKLIRLLLRVRTVFFRQSISWLVHGDIQDQSSEFFIQPRQLDGIRGARSTKSFGKLPGAGAGSIYDRVVQKLLVAAHEGELHDNGEKNLDSTEDDEKLDWNSSYFLKLDFLPESHVNARMAS